MKRCTKCGQELPVDDFPLRRKGEEARQPYCRTCKAVMQRNWYLKNRDVHRANVARTGREVRARIRARNQALVRELKAQPCSMCGGCFPVEVMDFDHQRGTKMANVSALMNRSTAVLRAEIAKCEVICAVCHRIRTMQSRSRNDECAARESNPQP